MSAYVGSSKNLKDLTREEDVHACAALDHEPCVRESVCVCVCVCVRERERERECVSVSLSHTDRSANFSHVRHGQVASTRKMFAREADTGCHSKQRIA